MRILSVASALPFPPDEATRNRAWNLLTRLAETEEVTLLTWLDPTFDPGLVDEVKKKIPKSIVLTSSPSDRSPSMWLRTRSKSVFKMTPPYVIERMRRQRVPDLDWSAFDLAVAEDDSALFLMPPVTCPVVVHRHNVFSDTIEGLAGSGDLGILRKIKWKMEMPIWNRFDRELGLRSDLLIVTTPEAERAVRRFSPDAHVEVVTNGVDMPSLALQPAREPVAVFIGNMSYEPNADAVGYFAKDVFPEVTSSIPDARFRIVGRHPLPAVLQLASENVDVVGEVPVMVQACDGAKMGVIPLRAGSGIKTKTLELMAMGLPVIATPQGCEGIDAEAEDGLIRVEDDRGFSRAVIDLMNDDERAVRLGKAARSYVGRFSWESAANRLRDVLRAQVNGRGQT